MDREAVGSVPEMKDAAETEGARRATGVSADAGGAPDPEVVAKPKRRPASAPAKAIPAATPIPTVIPISYQSPTSKTQCTDGGASSR